MSNNNMNPDAAAVNKAAEAFPAGMPPPPPQQQPFYPPVYPSYAAPPPPPGYPYQDSKAPNPAYISQQPGSTNTIIYTTVAKTPRTSMHVVCPNCKADVQTQVRYETGLLAWLSAGACCITGLWCGCCCVPFVVDSFKDAEHVCPNCNAKVADSPRI